MAADSAVDGKCHVLPIVTHPGYRGTMAGRRIRKKTDEPLDPKSLESLKAYLGPIAGQYTDAQLVQLECDMRAAARLLLDLYLLKKQSAEKAMRRRFDNPGSET